MGLRRRVRGQRHITAVCSVLVLVAAACGGGGDVSSSTADTASSPSPPPRQDGPPPGGQGGGQGAGPGTSAAPATSSTSASEPVRAFEVTPVDGFTLPGGIPNAVWLEGESQMVLIWSDDGIFEATSTDGVTFQGASSPNQNLMQLLQPLGLGAADFVLRETGTGDRRYFVKGLPPGGDESRHVYAADLAQDGTLTLINGGLAVFTGGANDSDRVEVFDIIETPTGEWRMLYVALPENSRTALSSDDGASWQFEFDDPFGDVTLSGADNVNVDPAPLRLSDGTYIAVTMRAGLLFIFTSEDGLNFIEAPGSSVDAGLWQDEAPAATGLFDPTLVQLPDGTILLYVTAGADAAGVIVAATVTIN